jgi:hypothetical protein
MLIKLNEDERKKIISLHEQWWKTIFGAVSHGPALIKKFSDIGQMYRTVIPNLGKGYYPNDNIKQDAYRHILASAYFTNKIGSSMTWIGGETNELLGALRSFIKGEGFDSGWEMDSKNNDIGINIAKKNPNSDLTKLSILVKSVIDSGDFYKQDGTLYKNK